MKFMRLSPSSQRLSLPPTRGRTAGAPLGLPPETSPPSPHRSACVCHLKSLRGTPYTLLARIGVAARGVCMVVLWFRPANARACAAHLILTSWRAVAAPSIRGVMRKSRRLASAASRRKQPPLPRSAAAEAQEKTRVCVRDQALLGGGEAGSAASILSPTGEADVRGTKSRATVRLFTREVGDVVVAHRRHRPRSRCNRRVEAAAHHPPKDGWMPPLALSLSLGLSVNNLTRPPRAPPTPAQAIKTT